MGYFGTSMIWTTDDDDEFLIDTIKQVEVTNPADLTTATHWALSDGKTAPQFPTFSSFTLSNICSSSVEIYEDKSKTLHSTLEIVQQGTQYVIRVTDQANYSTKASYTFYLLVRVQDSEDKWISVDGVEQFTLNTNFNCESYLIFQNPTIPG